MIQASPTILHWTFLTTIIFSIGIYGMLTRKSAVGILMAAELALNSAALNFVVFGKFIAPQLLEGEIFTLFIIAVAAAEVVVFMSILVALYRNLNKVDVTMASELKG